MRLMLTMAALAMVVSGGAAFAEDTPQEVKNPCREVTMPFLSLNYDARTTAAKNIARVAIDGKEAEIRAIAKAAGMTKIETNGLNYTVYNAKNGDVLQCNGEALTFKAGESLIRVKASYALEPLTAVSGFTDELLNQGYLPTVSEMKRTVCE